MAQEPAFKLIAGHVALDFANTLDNRFDPERVQELLTEYNDLLRFCEEAGVIDAAEASRYARLSEREKRAALRSAIELRELIERIFSGVAQGGNLVAEDIALLNAYVQRAWRERRLQLVEQHFRWAWKKQGATAPLWPITLAAAELLVSDDLRLVRECGAETCRWLFVDKSKNHSRRWCDMSICGNRSKARRYYRAHS